MKSLAWKAHRARSMSPLELAVRAAREARNLAEHARLAAGVSSQQYALDFRTATGGAAPSRAGRFFFDPGDDSLRGRVAPLSADYQAEADEMLAHRVRVLGHAYDLGTYIDWHRDYRLGVRCPIRYSALIDLKDPEFEESIRWVWYLNRHRHLASLGRAYFASRRPEYAKEIVDQLLSWIEQNPACVGVGWAASLEIALRLLSWAWALCPVRDFEGFTPDVQKRIMGSVGLQLRHMSRNLSTHSSANNHLVAQACALLVLGRLFGGMPGSRTWAANGAKIMWRELARQTFSDGVSREQSVHYHAFVLELYAVALIFAKRNALEIPAEVQDRFSRMCEFLFAVSDFAGAWGAMPAIGDSDDQTVVLPENPAQLLRGLWACAAYLMESREMAGSVGEVPLEAALLMGREGLDYVSSGKGRDSSTPGQTPQVCSRAFSEGGYYVLCDEADGARATFILDCGELGLGKTAAHGHADCLSLTLRVNQQEVLVDPGTFTYHSQPDWRSYFRSTAAHNTVVVDGVSQSEMLGPFVWGRRACPHLRDVVMESCFDLVDGLHDGYGRLRDPVKHRRALVFVKPDFLIIVDLLSAKTAHEYQQNFHLGATSSRCPDTGCVRIHAGDGVAAALFSPFLTNGTASVVEGQREPILGWRSPRFWEKSACKCVTARGRFKGNVLLESCLAVEPAGSPANQVSFSSTSGEDRLYCIVRREGPKFNETSLVNMGSRLSGEDELQSDASYICVREIGSDGDLEVFGRNVGKVVRRGEVLLECTERLAFVRVRMEKDTLRFESRGGGVVSVRTRDARTVVSSLSEVRYERKGEFLDILADT